MEMVARLSEYGKIWPPKNINGYQPKFFLELNQPDEETRKVIKPNVAPYWKWVYGWWPEGPQEENRDFHFIDDPLNAFISAGCIGKCALLSTDDDPYPELLAAQYGPGANIFAISIPIFKQIDEHTYQILPNWKEFKVEYPLLEKEKKYPELYKILEKNGFKYVGEVEVPKDVLPDIVVDVQKPPESLIKEKAEKPEPSTEMPSSVGPVPTITSEQKPSPTPESKAEKTPGFGIGEVLVSLAAVGIATLKIRKKK